MILSFFPLKKINNFDLFDREVKRIQQYVKFVENMFITWKKSKLKRMSFIKLASGARNAISSWGMLQRQSWVKFCHEINSSNINIVCHSFIDFSVDNYSSHEGEVYCNPHFKQLFQPKAKFESNDDPAPSKYLNYSTWILVLNSV